MKLITNKTKTAPATTFAILRAKGDVLPSWALKLKPSKITIDGKKVDVYANREKSDYIYFILPSDHDGFKVRCFWGKDAKQFEAFLKAPSFKVEGLGRTYKARVTQTAPKTEAAPKAKTSKKKGNPKADSKGEVPAPKTTPKRGIKVIKKDQVQPQPQA